MRYIEEVLNMLAKGGKGFAPLLVLPLGEMILVLAVLVGVAFIYVISVGYFFKRAEENKVLYLAGGAFALFAGYLVVNEICGHCLPTPGDTPECSAIEHYDLSQKKCVPNQTVNPVSDQCLLNEHYDSSLNKCVPNQTSNPTQFLCLLGEHYDASLNKCVSNQIPDPVQFLCLIGEHYDFFLKRCVRDQTSNPFEICLSGHFDRVLDKCVPDPVCPSGRRYSELLKICILDFGLIQP